MGMKALKQGDSEKALKYFRISSRLDPNDDIDAMIQQLENKRKANSSGSDRTKDDTVRHKSSSHDSIHASNATDSRVDNVHRVLRATTLYERLGVVKTSTPTEIRKSYRKLALQLHPDKNQHPKADEAFKAVAEVFEILSDPEKKQQYDLFGETKTTMGPGRDARRREFQDMDDLIRHFFFENAAPTRTRFATRHPRQQSQPAFEQATPIQSLVFLLLNALFIIAVFLPVLAPYFDERTMYNRRPTVHSAGTRGH